jgi:hypothetical protein
MTSVSSIRAQGEQLQSDPVQHANNAVKLLAALSSSDDVSNPQPKLLSGLPLRVGAHAAAAATSVARNREPARMGAHAAAGVLQGGHPGAQAVPAVRPPQRRPQALQEGQGACRVP